MSLEIYREPKILDFNIYGNSKKLVAQTHSTWSSKPPSEILNRMEEKDFEKKYFSVREAIKDGYGSILEITPITFEAILPRYCTLALTSFLIGSSFLQQSLRYTLPSVKVKETKNSIIFVPKNFENFEEKIINNQKEALNLYEKLLYNIKTYPTRKPEEEARYHLGWHTGTFITANINTSHVTHMLALVKKYSAPSIWSEFVLGIREKIREKDKNMAELIDYVSENLALGKFYPIPYPFLSSNFLLKEAEKFEKNNKSEVRLLSYDVNPIKNLNRNDIKEILYEGIEEGNFNDLAFVNFVFTLKHSGVVAHEIIRHRTILQSLYSFQDVGERREIIYTPALRNMEKTLLKEYNNHLEKTLQLYQELRDFDEIDAIGILPHSLAFVNAVRIDGYNIFNYRGFLGNRCCELSQGEMQYLASMISVEINKILRKEGFEDLTKITHANCFKLRRCPELKDRAEKCSIYKNKSFEQPLFSS